MNNEKPITNSKYVSNTIINELYINIITNKQYFTLNEYSIARNYILINTNNIVSALSNSYKNQYPGFDQQDFRQAGLIGLINCLEKYDPNKNTKFTTFAYHVIKCKMLNITHLYYAQKRTSKGVTSLNNKIGNEDSELGELIEDPKQEELFNNYVINDTFKQIYDLLKNEDRILIDAWLLCEGKIINQYLKMDDETCSAIYRRLFRHIRDLVVNVVSKIDYQRIT